jgi:ADP-ribosylglycohydrolase
MEPDRLAGAVGDALGAPVEFMSIQAIRDRYGLTGLTGYDTAYGRTGAITDDTQMTMFTVEGLLLPAGRWIRSSVRSTSQKAAAASCGRPRLALLALTSSSASGWAATWPL